MTNYRGIEFENIESVKKATKVLIPLTLISLSIAIWMGVEMLNRTKAELLWGYRPLVLFVSLWSFLVAVRLLIQTAIGKKPVSWRWLGLSYLSGLLLAVGFPDLIPMPLLMFIGFVPLLIVEQEVAAQHTRKSGRKVLRYAYQAFIFWNIVTTYWVTNTALIAGFFAISVNALLMCIPFVLFHHTKKVMPRLGYPAFILYWIAFEYLHLSWELTWPWLTLGNSFAEYPSWIQWYEYTGAFGGSLWILGLNVLVLQAWNVYKEKQSWRMGQLIRIGLLIIAPIVLSLIIYFTYEEKGTPKEVVVVQPNYEPHYEKFEIPEPEQIERFVELTESVITDQTEYVVYPETSFGYVETTQMDGYPSIRRLRAMMQPYSKLKVITGVNAYHDFGPTEPHSYAVRERTRNGQVVYFEIYNAAIQLSNESSEIPLYKKSKLVPGPEIFPYRNLLFFVKPVIERLEGTTAGVAVQEERDVLSSSSGRVAPVICYESVFGEYHNGYFRKGKEAEAIFIMTNDGWWDNTAGHRQHLYFASMRAIETRRPVARSANTGISAFINQRGDILQATKYDEPVAIKGEILFNSEFTFYIKWGDMIARLAAFVTVLLLLNTLVKRLKP